MFHNDQHATSTLILSALINATKIADKPHDHCRVVICGCGAEGVATTNLLLDYGFQDIVLVDSHGIIFEGREENMNSVKTALSLKTNPRRLQEGGLKAALEGADIFIGLSSGATVSKEIISRMSEGAIVLALSNPLCPVQTTRAPASIAP